MAISNSSTCVLKEWAPLTDLINKIPTKPNLSIFSEDVKITCVDIISEFIALGTNYGMAYWYDRKKKELQRLRCENSNIPITSIKVLSTVDYMLACGSNTGNISIFQIPKTHPDWIPEKFKPKNKSVERYTVSDLHKSPISTLEWSKNGMKLFSGDKHGTIVLTELDFYMHICKSLEILNESYEVIQLSYCNPKLIVSTTYRSIICENTDKWNVMQIGQKDRKILGAFGGLIRQDRIKAKHSVIYCARPGLRIWVSDSQGNVQKTLLFKELLSRECAEVPLLNPVSKNLQSCTPKDVNFGIILPFGENLLITYNNSIVYILDPDEMTVVAKISQLRRVLDVACHKDEIFILEEDRNIIRISTKPETSPEFVNASSGDNSFFPCTIKDLTSKLQPSNILSAIPPVIEHAFTSYNINEHTDGELVMNAEEAIETCTEKPQTVECSKKFDNIEDEESVDIIYKHKKHRKKHHDKERLVSNSLSSNSSAEENIIRPTIMNLSSVGTLPDLRSPKSIQSDIEYKEKILADVLNFDKKLTLNFVNEVQSKKQSSVIKNDQILEADAKKEKSGDVNKNIENTQTRPKNIEGSSNKDESQSDNLKYDNDSSKKPLSRYSIKREISGIIEIPIMSRSTETPACVDIPNGWNLTSITLKSASSDPSLSDWEIL